MVVSSGGGLVRYDVFTTPTLATEHKMKSALILLTVAFTLMGCDGMSRSQKGALTGAALGSGIGLVAGGSAGQVIGAGLIGGAAGYIVGSIP